MLAEALSLTLRDVLALPAERSTRTRAMASVVVCNTIDLGLTSGSIQTCWMKTIRSRLTIRPHTLFKHPRLGIDEIDEVWASSPLFYPAKPPAHWLMCAEVGGRVLMVPLAPARSGDPRR
jgi:hypothetical protein